MHAPSFQAKLASWPTCRTLRRGMAASSLASATPSVRLLCGNTQYAFMTCPNRVIVDLHLTIH